MDAQTRSNIMAALQSEAFACARYTLMAAEARSEGDVPAAELLEGISRIDSTEHFAELGKLVGLVGGDADNLVAAINEESREREESYRLFAQQARAAGDYEVADLFERIRADKRDAVRALEGELERLEVPA
ncbi:MAG TPA: ferritin family protein [Gaiellaceae bacterium]|nr:ferritin family protein [Gaiellaceae bacterium]